MIAGTYTQGGQLRIVDVPVPETADDELLVRVEAAAICGSDIKIIRHGHRKLRNGQTLILGHELVGTVEKAGPKVADYPVGMRVGLAPNVGCAACEMCRRGLGNMCPDYQAFGITFDGGHAEMVRVPAEVIAQGNVIPLPNDVSSVDAALIEPLSCAVNSIRAGQVAEGDRVLVYGAGPMGLLNALVARAAGAQVWISDPNEKRLRFARQFPIDDAVNPQRTAVPDWIAGKTDGRGVDAVIVAVPSADLQREGLGLLAPYGRLCLFAGLPRGHGGVDLDTNAIHYKNLIVTGTTGGSARDYREALGLIQSGRVEVAKLVSHVIPFRDMEKAYQTALAGEGMKIVMVPEVTGVRG